MGMLNRFLKESGAIFADSLDSLQSLVKDYGATIIGTPKIVRSPFGPSVSFTGSPDTIQLPIPLLQLGTEDFSFVFWINVDTTSGHEQLYSKITTGQAGIDILVRNTGRLGAFIRDGAAGGVISADDGDIIDDGTWRHVVITFDRDGDMIRYVDGLVYGSATTISGESGSLDNTTEAYFGSLEGSTRFLIGEIRDPIVFNRVLTAGEVTVLAKNQWYDWLWKGGDLQFSADMREDAVARIEAGEPAEVDPTVEAVSAVGLFPHYLSTRLEQAILNTARITSLGMIVEGPRTDYLIDKQDFGSAAWINRVGTPVVTVNTDAAPDGTMTADTVEDDNASLAESLGQVLGGGTLINPESLHEWAIYVKKTSGVVHAPSIQVRFSGGGGVGQVVTVNPNTGAFLASSHAFFADAGVDSVGDYWRIWGVRKGTAGDTAFQFDFAPAFANVSDLATQVVSLTGSHVFWGATLREGYCVTNYTPGDLDTRTAEDLRYDNTAERNLEAAASSIAFSVTPQFDGDYIEADVYAFDFSDGTNGPRGFFDQSNGGKLTIEWLSGGAAVATLVALAAPVKGTTYRVITGGQVDDFFLNINGIEQDTQGASAAAPTAVNSALFWGQDRANANQLNGNLVYLKIWKRVLGVRERIVYDIEQAVRLAA